MKSLLTLVKKYPFVWAVYFAFVVVYILQATLVSVDPSTLTKYRISEINLRLLSLAIEIPYIIIWIIALVGYMRLRSYAEAIKNEKDGQAFYQMSHGLLLIVIWLPANAIINNAFTQIYRFHPQYTAALIRTSNYLELIILSIGFYLLYSGSQKLLSFISRAQITVNFAIVIAYIAFSAIYTYLVLHDPARALPTKGLKTATYYEHDWLIIFTIIIPRLVYWFLGIQAAYNIYLYQKKVKGKIYKNGLNTLAIGILGIIGTTIFLRILQSITVTLIKFSLSWLLVLIYFLLIIMCIAYVYLAKGSKKLLRLEEL
jgi:hypothetical protein